MKRKNTTTPRTLPQPQKLRKTGTTVTADEKLQQLKKKTLGKLQQKKAPVKKADPIDAQKLENARKIEEALQKIKQLESDLMNTPTKSKIILESLLTNLPLDASKPQADEPIILQTIKSCWTLFQHITQLKMVPSLSFMTSLGKKRTNDVTYVMGKLLLQFFNSLLFLLSSSSSYNLQKQIVTTIIEMFKFDKDEKILSTPSYRSFIRGLVKNENLQSFPLEHLGTEIFAYDDGRFWTLRHLTSIIQSERVTRPADQVGKAHVDVDAFLVITFELLKRLQLPEEARKKTKVEMEETYAHKVEEIPYDISTLFSSRIKISEDETELKLKDLHRQFQDCWLAFLSIPLPNSIMKEILSTVDSDLLPFMDNPVHFHNLFLNLYNMGGTIGILALNGLFVMITKYNLDMPNFYAKIYDMLSPSVLLVKYRARFFELMWTFLASPMLPLNYVCAFIKRLFRLALTAPPSSALVVMVFVHNLLRRHPTSLVLFQRNKWENVVVMKEGRIETFPDPYIEDASIDDCDAVLSSVWEVEALKQHYHPQVSRFANEFYKDIDFPAEAFAIPNFISISYESEVNEVFERQVRENSDVPLSHNLRGLFDEQDPCRKHWNFEKQTTDQNDPTHAIR